MREKLYGVVIIVLTIIALILIGVTLVVFSKAKTVDCGTVLKDLTGTSYRPVPKQCEKGE